MKKTMTIFAALTLTVMIMFVSQLSMLAQHQRMGKNMGPDNPDKMMRVYHLMQGNQKELKITDSQLEKIKDTMFAFEEKSVSLRNKNNVLEIELKKLLMDKKNQDYGKIKKVLSQISNNQHTIFIEQLKTRNTLETILTQEQRDALKDMVKKKREELREFRFNRRGDRMPSPFFMMRHPGEERMEQFPPFMTGEHE